MSPRSYPFRALVVLSLVALARPPVPGQCPPPPGVYTITASLAPGSGPPCPGGTASIDIIGSSTGPGITGFGFNVVLGGGPFTAVAVTPGFVPAPGGGFASAIGPTLDEVSALGVANPGVFLTLLATIDVTLDPAAVGPVTVTFGGVLPLASGIVPFDHVVVAGCDVWSGSVPALSTGGGPFACPNFIRGDCNQNGVVAGFVGDIVYLLDYLFVGTVPAPACELACDANDDEALGISDAILLLNWQVLAMPPPPPPTPMFPAVAFLADCGPDPTPGPLTCVAGICP